MTWYRTKEGGYVDVSHGGHMEGAVEVESAEVDRFRAKQADEWDRIVEAAEKDVAKRESEKVSAQDEAKRLHAETLAARDEMIGLVAEMRVLKGLPTPTQKQTTGVKK